MNFSHVKKLQKAKKMIARHGRKVLLVVKGAAIDPEKPWLGTLPDVKTEALAVFVPFKGSGFGETTEQVGLLKKVNEVCLIAPDITFDITSVVSIEDGQNTSGVEWIEVLRPSDVTILAGLGVNR